jgi:hypothetical protein
VYDLVLASHFSLERVEAHLAREPGLAQTAYDWGFGDWESPLAAASHVGRRDIAAVLLEHGAQPNLLMHAMLGDLEVVRAVLEAAPAMERSVGPHGLTLMHHARVGGENAAVVVEFLESKPGADAQAIDPPVIAEEADAFVGCYRCGDDVGTVLRVSRHRRGHLVLQVGGRGAQSLRRTSEATFSPAGVPSVRLKFALEDGRASRLAIEGWVEPISARRL